MGVISIIVTGAYKPTYNWGASHCSVFCVVFLDRSFRPKNEVSSEIHMFFLNLPLKFSLQICHFLPLGSTSNQTKSKKQPAISMAISGTDWLEVPAIYKAYVREYPHKIWSYMVQYLHFRILEFPLTILLVSCSISHRGTAPTSMGSPREVPVPWQLQTQLSVGEILASPEIIRTLLNELNDVCISTYIYIYILIYIYNV